MVRRFLRALKLVLHAPLLLAFGGTEAAEVVAIAAGESHTVVTFRDGTTQRWGQGDAPVSTNQPAATPQYVAVAPSKAHTVALKKDGTVVSWGANWSECWQLADGTTMGSAQPVPVIGLDGLEATGWPVIPYEAPFRPLSGVKAIAAGGFHSLALKTDGTIWAWGCNYFWGQLGDGTCEWRPNPVRVAGLSNVVAIAAGKYHSVALCADGSVWTWGANQHGQLGLSPPDFEPHPTPIRIVPQPARMQEPS
jgi:alpha-tubulin suppressor-like RCC1 family protein